MAVCVHHMCKTQGSGPEKKITPNKQKKTREYSQQLVSLRVEVALA